MRTYTMLLNEAFRERDTPAPGDICLLRPVLFDFDYPLIDDAKPLFESMFFKRFAYRNINFDSPAMFKHQLDSKLFDLAPRYNNLYKSLDIFESPFANHMMQVDSELREKHRHKGMGTSHDHKTSEAFNIAGAINKQRSDASEVNKGNQQLTDDTNTTTKSTSNSDEKSAEIKSGQRQSTDDTNTSVKGTANRKFERDVTDTTIANHLTDTSHANQFASTPQSGDMGLKLMPDLDPAHGVIGGVLDTPRVIPVINGGYPTTLTRDDDRAVEDTKTLETIETEEKEAIVNANRTIGFGRQAIESADEKSDVKQDQDVSANRTLGFKREAIETGYETASGATSFADSVSNAHDVGQAYAYNDRLAVSARLAQRNGIVQQYGLQGVTLSAALLEWRTTFINVNKQLLDELETLFILVY